MNSEMFETNMKYIFYVKLKNRSVNFLEDSLGLIKREMS